MSSLRATTLPGIVLAGASYPNDERVFQCLPRNHPKRIRHREVEQFRGPAQLGEKPRWDASVRDEDHKFPERPIMHSLNTYEGVEIVDGTFPETLQGTTHLRRQKRSPLWNTNTSKPLLSCSRFHLPQMSKQQQKENPLKLSFLATVIATEFSDEKMRLKRGWCASTLTPGMTNPHQKWRETVNYVELNKSKKGVLNEDSYIAPQRRVARMNEDIQDEKRKERERAEAAAMPHADLSETPKVFKMSNIDEWWHLDPTRPILAADVSSVDVQEEIEAEN